MTKVAIFGVGLIGGSLALCLKGKPGLRVAGHSNNPASVDKYLKRGVVDEATTSMEEAARDADFIFLCVPVGCLEDYLQKLNGMRLKPGCIISDVGSTKRTVMDAAKSLHWENVHFIGGHPMAGKEQSGVEAATSHLFENAFYVLTPDESTPALEVERLEQLLAHTRAHIVKMAPAQHDDIVGAVSHLPHVIAVALVNQVADYNEENDLYERLAAGGFRDITRIASSDPIIWRDILLNNRSVVLRLLEDWKERMDGFIDMLNKEDGAGIESEFMKAGSFRNALPERRKGVIHSTFDVYVDVPDHPGVVGEIAGQLGSRQINLSNIQIMESRLDVPGVMRLSFREEEQLDRAVEVLKELGYSLHF
ncbi:prephenate dehydrogenase [Xylanibacillus composti]|uniref:Prephenate dehydrogenase n=1 Tax=Xylanibacillus composti TaxID=1572762 RepID=A0A8J4H2K5_9BACL|nr:prephenate dehydrogenase [Xylanibacillus composti]MDT9725475.1 prephenate dehydrogenase [Xylanibacillus composti]GIQ67568.1 prephenate dehydrogenase [Xylanibacillus composti]